MPPPVVIYVGGVMIVLGAAYALKQFVYEPYVAPQLEKWASAFLETRRRHKEERRMHGAMPMRAGYEYLFDEEDERRDMKAREGASNNNNNGYSRRSEWDDSVSMGGHGNVPRQPAPPIELDKMVEREKLAWMERDGPVTMPIAAAPGLRRRTGSRPASRPVSFVEISETPGLPASAYIPLTPAPTNEASSPRSSNPNRPAHPLSSPQPAMQQIPAPPILSPPVSATSAAPVMRAPLSPISRARSEMFNTHILSPTHTSEDPGHAAAAAGDEVAALHLVLRSPAPAPLDRTASPAPFSFPPSTAGSPYPSRPASALSSVLSPPHSTLSLPSIARTHSWTALSRGSAVSDADVLSQSSRDGFGTDEDGEGASEVGSVSDLGSAWDDVSRRSGMSARSM